MTQWLECDLVMKGGVTSGTVYPKAIAKLAGRYRFRCIGGASAGAIAAAAAAAAEYQRHILLSAPAAGPSVASASAPHRAAPAAPANQPNAGFDILRELPAELGKTGSKGIGSRLLELFQPQRRYRGLFLFLLSFLGEDRTAEGTGTKERSAAGKFLLIGRVGWRAIRFFPQYAAPGALAALALAWLLGFSFTLDIPLARWITPLALAFATAAAAAFYGIWRSVIALPANGFGMCKGYQAPPHAGAKWDDSHLSTYLFELLQRCAGRTIDDAPLTFGDLKQANIKLAVMTTNLCYGQPHRLPFGRGEARRFFSETEWAQLFPPQVMAHLKNHPPHYLKPRDGAAPPKPSSGATANAGDGKLTQRQRVAADICRTQNLTPLPDEDDFPVIVAVRLSLSFPLLLAAVPIHLYDPAASVPKGAAAAARECWFSDGGLSSNFPLHFFDTALPSRPTFAFNLEEVETGFQGDKASLPVDNSEGLQRTWSPLDTRAGAGSMAGFGLALINVMQNWRDNALLRLPGYRDRVVGIKLEAHEGGLNLNMPAPLIAELSQRGEQGADKLIAHFDPAGQAACKAQGIQTTWENHRWMRMLTTLAGIERLLEEIDRSWVAPSAGERPYPELLDPARTPQSDLPSYVNFSNRQRELANGYVEALRALSSNWNRTQALTMYKDTPRPYLHFRQTGDS